MKVILAWQNDVNSWNGTPTFVGVFATREAVIQHVVPENLQAKPGAVLHI